MWFRTVALPKKASWILGWCVMLGVLVGCAGIPSDGISTRSASPEEIVAERAQKRWDALVAGDVEKAYAYLSPASRQIRSLAVYRSSLKIGFWKAAKVERVLCPETRLCEVHLIIEYVQGFTIASPARESWAQTEGQWWYVLK
jgi:hypothetical protein